VYEHDIERLSYWVVPALSNALSSVSSRNDINQVLDLEQIRKVSRDPVWKWTAETNSQDLIDKYFVDPMNGGRRYFSNCIASHLKPQDPVPTHKPRQNHKFMSNILDYTDSKWLKSRDITRWNQNQPVLQVEKIPFRRNHLARVEDKEKKELDELKTYICPEPLHISNVSTMVKPATWRSRLTISAARNTFRGHVLRIASHYSQVRELLDSTRCLRCD